MNLKKIMSRVISALQSRKKERLGNIKKICSNLLLIESYNNPTAKNIISEIVGKSQDYRELTQYFLYNLYYGYYSNPDPTNKYYMDLVKLISKMFLEYDDPEIKGIALGALGNLGSYAVRYLGQTSNPDPIMIVLGHLKKKEKKLQNSKRTLSPPENFLKECAEFAIECNPINQPEGKPKLQRRELNTVRVEQGVDVPAYQESEHYMLDDFDNDGDDKKSKIIIPGR